METKKRQHLWFLAPDPKTETNDKLAKYLDQESIKAGSPGQIVVDGSRVNGWFVEHRVITIMQKAAREFNFKFRIFVREGEGKWRENFLHKKRYASVHFKAAQEELKKKGARK